MWNSHDTSWNVFSFRQTEFWPDHTWLRSKDDHVIRRMQRANSWQEACWDMKIKKGDRGINTVTITL